METWLILRIEREYTKCAGGILSQKASKQKQNDRASVRDTHRRQLGRTQLLTECLARDVAQNTIPAYSVESHRFSPWHHHINLILWYMPAIPAHRRQRTGSSGSSLVTYRAFEDRLSYLKPCLAGRDKGLNPWWLAYRVYEKRKMALENLAETTGSQAKETQHTSLLWCDNLETNPIPRNGDTHLQSYRKNLL